MWQCNLDVYPIQEKKKKTQNVLILIWSQGAFRDMDAPYLGFLADAPSPPLRDKNQNFHSSPRWAGARKFLTGSLCPTRGITPWSHQEQPAKWSFPRLSACSSTIFGACFHPQVFPFFCLFKLTLAAYCTTVNSDKHTILITGCVCECVWDFQTSNSSH